jgi:hypothetical protein
MHKVFIKLVIKKYHIKHFATFLSSRFDDELNKIIDCVDNPFIITYSTESVGLKQITELSNPVPEGLNKLLISGEVRHIQERCFNVETEVEDYILNYETVADEQADALARLEIIREFQEKYSEYLKKKKCKLEEKIVMEKGFLSRLFSKEKRNQSGGM